MAIDDTLRKELLFVQRLELTEHILYNRLAESAKDKKNKKILKDIADMELDHYNFFKKVTKTDVKPHTFKIFVYFILSRIIGITFGVKLMEFEERSVQKLYKDIIKKLPKAKKLLKEEEEHEEKLIKLLHERKLNYIGSMVLGLNDALVELTGALAGLTLAFRNTTLIAVAGLITGIAASLSMAASEYLSTKSEKVDRNPVTAAIYTGVAYILTVIILIIPYLVFDSAFTALPVTIVFAILIILVFTFYTAIANSEPFWKRFGEMTAISLGVAALSFLIGIAIRHFIGIEV